MDAPVGFTDTDRAFFARDVFDVAPQLLGCALRRTDAAGTVALRITEVEAYAGERDPGSHSYRGRTARNATMFGPAGHVYCYFSYGLHHAVNLVTGRVGQPYGCLVRAGRVVEGVELARRRREAGGRRSPLPDRALARGPGNVAQALGATLADDGDDLFGSAWQFFVPTGAGPDAARPTIATGPRVGVSGPAGDAVAFPWRYWIAGDPTVSSYRPAKPRLPAKPHGPSETPTETRRPTETHHPAEPHQEEPT
ncbi:DNA-3-methyladenine glycosylase [Herbiconiux daphne]|uniref:Putative 3-methyladenine DNA glycosylase n=1 Tax=Herbiconiux daphne TaxID=2970914 RepID=A0ABT2H7V1_9MICO|nr:DNA-3-methyladenine glycosylase [Herbiconiux daphne]MCS5736045.1 DNA-3-methyladenine glycosylase [Herbiconiux daphne]